MQQLRVKAKTDAGPMSVARLPINQGRNRYRDVLPGMGRRRQEGRGEEGRRRQEGRGGEGSGEESGAHWEIRGVTRREYITYMCVVVGRQSSSGVAVCGLAG